MAVSANDKVFEIMSMEFLLNEDSALCPSPDISAYIDGELSPDDEIRFEMHIADCRVCRSDLNLQKTFLNALDSSIEGAGNIELPPDFTKSVVANAESRVSGLRRPHERRNAALICIALILFSLFGLGSNAERSFAAATGIAEKFLVLTGSVLHFAYDIALGSAIVFKSLALGFVFDSNAIFAFVLLLLVLSLYLFSRLLGEFRRT
ncbi:MAG: zf-HC2 domain-containing protein [Pyrinomonadaceae bacterium]